MFGWVVFVGVVFVRGCVRRVGERVSFYAYSSVLCLVGLCLSSR